MSTSAKDDKNAHDSSDSAMMGGRSVGEGLTGDEMKDFSAIRFKGTFRDYQQKVLDEAKTHFADGKVHIVAAPGSGKTVLGLELIRRLGKPTLILSPTIVIAQQWGERFDEMFLPEGDQLQDYVSQNLRKPALVTSITYQALHAA
ncbi:MAG: DEAD/DEAH box helicase family protein, partial [Coriobacteriales bacterium]|nr:DEAD/DEAH box helicase family protein [Coriobacteriales bacterium]